MKSSTFLPTFIRYSFNALITLWIVYLLADYHINQLPWFSLQEWFMIAGEALVFCAFILAFKDTRKSPFQMMMEDLLSDLHTSCETYSEWIKDSAQELMNFWKKTTKWIPLSEEHKKKISESLKKKNAEKKAQEERIKKTATASQKRKTAKK